MTEWFEMVAVTFEVAGVGTMLVGFVVSTALAVRAWGLHKNGTHAITTLRESLGAVILLGLEILVAADLVKTVTSPPALEDALVLALIVLIRTVLSFSLQVEIEGVAPWRRALLTGPKAVADVVAKNELLGRGDAPLR